MAVANDGRSTISVSRRKTTVATPVHSFHMSEVFECPGIEPADVLGRAPFF